MQLSDDSGAADFPISLGGLDLVLPSDIRSVGLCSWFSQQTLSLQNDHDYLFEWLREGAPFPLLTSTNDPTHTTTDAYRP